MSNFWSRRRQAVAAEAEEAARRDRAVAAERRAEVDAARSEAEMLAELDLPDPDTLGAGDDFAAFLRAEVPAALRRRALRRLWRSNPTLACLDGLVDYAEDYTDAGLAARPVTTTYRVGRGLARHLRVLAEAAERPEEAAAPVPEALEVAADAPATAERAPEPATAEADAPAPAPTPRRMAFRFEEASA